MAHKDQNYGGVYPAEGYLGNVADTAKILSCILSALFACTAAAAVGGDSGNPYQAIVDRNVFGLKPPPPPPGPEEKKVDLPPITLTGITTILGNKRALMNVQQPGKQAKSYILAEGQREGELEVLEIDEKAGSVKVNQSGTIVPLSFEKNGAKLPIGPPPQVNLGTPTPGVPYPAPSPATLPYVPSSTAPPQPGTKPIPTRQVRLPTPGGAPAPGSPNPADFPRPGGARVR